MVMALLVIVTGIAMAQVQAPVVTCSSYNQQTARLRQENQTELVPALTFKILVVRTQLANRYAHYIELPIGKSSSRSMLRSPLPQSARWSDRTGS